MSDYVIHPNEGDVIVHTFDEGMNVSDVYKVQSELIHMFPNNSVIAVPSKSMIEVLDEEAVIRLLQLTLDSLRGDLRE